MRGKNSTVQPSARGEGRGECPSLRNEEQHGHCRLGRLPSALAIFVVIAVGTVLAFFILYMSPPAQEEYDHGHEPKAEARPTMMGPHGGRLLMHGDFQLEVVLHGRGVPPQFRVYPYERAQPISPKELQLHLELHRLNGRKEVIRFQPQGDYLHSVETIEKPHSFEVKVTAEKGSQVYQWHYSQVEGRLKLGPEVLRNAGITTKAAGPAPIKTVLQLPGEIQFNQNRLAHVVPRLAGVVVEVRKNLNDPVAKNEILAVLESRELAELKSHYATALKRLELARATFERERRLWQARISAEQDYLASQKELAEAEIAVETAAQSLLSLGLANTELRTISKGIGQALARYELRAPFDGVIIDKHLVLGEAVKEDTAIFTIADLSSVWGEITVYAKDLNLVRTGQKTTVKSDVLGLSTEGTIFYLGPLIGEQTRSAKAYVHIPNPEGRWRPGLFVTVEVVQDEVEVPVAVEAEAIQTYRDEPVVFVQYGDFFEAWPVELGHSDGQWVEVVKGLSAGERYVARNSFVLKSELEKSDTAHGPE